MMNPLHVPMGLVKLGIPISDTILVDPCNGVLMKFETKCSYTKALLSIPRYLIRKSAKRFFEIEPSSILFAIFDSIFLSFLAGLNLKDLHTLQGLDGSWISSKPGMISSKGIVLLMQPKTSFSIDTPSAPALISRYP